MCYTSSSSDLDKFGLGTVLYFRFLKYITFFFFLFALLSVPALVFTLGASHDSSINGLKDYKGALFLTTLGSLQRGTTSCTQTQLNSLVTLSCERGVLGPLSTLQYGRSSEDSNLPCNLFNIYSWDTQCNNNDIQAIQASYADCEGQDSCSFELTQDFFDSSKSGCNFNQDSRFYISAYCEETTWSIFQRSNISKMTLGYIIASIDALICLIYVIMLIVLRKMEKKTVFYLEGNVQSVSGYTLKISNLPKGSSFELKKDLWKHFSQVKENGNIIKYNIVDVQIAESQSLLDLQTQLANLKKKKYQLYKRFFNDWSHQHQNLSKIPTYEDIKKLVSKGNKHMMKEFQEIQKIKEKQTKLKKKIEHQKSHIKHVPIAAFITFETQQERNDAYEKFHKSHFSRFAFQIFPSFYRKDINIFQGRYLKVKTAPSTDNILWANIGVSKLQKFFRRILSWIITIGFWAISFALIVVVKTKQEDSSNLVQPTLDCSNYPDLTEQQVLDDIAQGSNALGLQECFCRSDFERQLTVGACREWASQKLLVNALPFLAVIGIIVINYCLQYVFKLLSNYEKHADISTQSTSRVIKIFVAQFLNTGVILLIVNAKFSRKQVDNFLEGSYTDLTSDWYLNVGTILLMTMILNIVNLPFVNLVFYLIGAMRRCFDRNCTCDHKSTSKETQEEWVKLYTGPEFLVDFRYAQILTIIFICFLYSPGIPILYITSFLNLFVIYWMDKFLVLRICRLSKTFDDTMENVVRKTLFFALFFHLISAVWTYGNSQLFSGESYFVKQLKVVISAQNREDSFFISSMKYRAIESYNISLTVLFVLFVVALLLRLFLKNTFYRLKAFCSKKRHRKVSDEIIYPDQKTYFDLINLEDLQREKKYLEKEIYEISDAELKAFLGQRLERISQEIQKRNPEEENRLTKFRGPFSYFVGHNQAFRPMFPVEDVPFPHAPMI